MASSGAAVTSRAGVIRVLVAAMGDSSRSVQEAAASALCENAKQNAGAVLDCCGTSLRAGKRREGQVASYRAGLLLIMAYTVREMGEEQINQAYMRNIAKLAMNELSSNKEFNLDWNCAASSLLVAVGSRLPDVLMDEVFNQLAGSTIPVIALVQILAEFAKSYALQFAPRLKNVLSRVLPVLGGVKDNQRKIFAEAFTSWCEAMTQFYELCTSTSSPGEDMQAMLHSAFELFLNSWVVSHDAKVRLATAEALGKMVGLLSKSQLQSALPRLLPSIMAVYKKEKEDPLPATSSLHIVLVTILLNDGGSPMVDFLALAPVLQLLLPMAYLAAKNETSTELSSQLKNLNEVLRCFITIGMVYPGELFNLLLHHLRTQEDSIQLGTLSLCKHLLTRLSDPWFSRRGELAEAVNDLLQKKDMRTRKSIAELVVSMASSGLLDKETGEVYIEFLVKQCAISDTKTKLFHSHHAAVEKPSSTESADTNLDKTGDSVSPSELRAVCDKGLLLLAGTVAGAEVVLWPFLLKMLMPVQYTAAVAAICKCIAELLRRMLARGETVSVDYTTSPKIPQPEELLARLLILLQDPLAKDQLASQVLTILNYLGPIFPTAVVLLWEEEIPKLKAYISDINDETWQQSTWEDMIMHLLSELLDVVHDPEWILSFGNALASHYDLYLGDNEHSALLHRCMGTVLWKVDDKSYVQRMISLMYRCADIANETNRLGLAMAMGLVASAHLDSVLEKLQRVRESHNRKGIYRLVSHFTEQQNTREVDIVFAALALMYGYSASHAPSSAIEARIDTLVVELEHLRWSCSAIAMPRAPRDACGCSLSQGSNKITGFLKVRAQTARQAVITAINLLGQAVIKAANNGIGFPLKKRDSMLDYVIALMARQGKSTLDLKLLRTQELALNACTTLVSIEPRLTVEMRDHVLQATFRFFTLPGSVAVNNTVFSNLTTLLCAILNTSGEDGKSRANQLQHLLKNLDQYVSSSIEYQRERACCTVLALLRQFRALCVAGSCPFNCTGNCMHLRSVTDRGQSTAAAPALLPLREALKLGERTMAYMPRCGDVSPVIKKVAAQVLEMLFTISMLLPGPFGSKDQQAYCATLSALTDLIAATKWEAGEGEMDVLRGIVDAVGVLLSTTEVFNTQVVAALKGCKSAICDKVLQSGQGAIAAVTQLTSMRGSQLREGDIYRITQALFAAAAAEFDRQQEVLAAICCLAEHSIARVVFDEVLAAAETEFVKDESSRKGWPVQEAILAIAHHEGLSIPFLEYVVGILDQVHVYRDDDADKGDLSEHLTLPLSLSQLPQAATLALGTIFRGANDVVKKAVDQCYPAVLCSLLLRIGSIHGTFRMDMQPLRDIVTSFQFFCETIGDEEMGKVLYTDGEQRLSGERWIEAIEEIASCSARTRPQAVDSICTVLWPALKRPQDFQRAAAAAALSRFVQHSEDTDALLGHLVGALSAHINDESPTVRCLCVRGLVQLPQQGITKYASQVLTVIVVLMEDTEEEVAHAAVCGLSAVMEVATEEIVAPMLVNLCERLLSLQARQMESIRGAAFQALGSLSKFATGVQLEAFMEQVHTTLPRLVFHVNDEAPSVSLACKNTLRQISPLLHAQDIRALANLRTFDFGRRLEYDEFVKEFVKHLVLQFRDKEDTYVASAIQAFESPWPLIQANAAYFAGCLLSEVKDTKFLDRYLPQVTSLLVKMTANSPSAIVRAKSTLALSLLLNDMQISNS